MDVIALRQYGLDIAVASLGTATTENQLRLMFRYTSQVICLYDGDNAGRKAAEHAFETITPFIDATMDMRFAFLPAEHDPDSLVREGGADAVNAILDSSQSYPEFLIKSQQQRFNLSDPSQMAIFLNSCIEIIGRITDDVLCTIC
ncbi:toprim domain-containing protein, partial [Enterobacter cloacae]